MGKKEKSALNVAKFIKSQTLILLDKLNELDDDESAAACEKLHDDAEALHELLDEKWNSEEED